MVVEWDFSISDRSKPPRFQLTAKWEMEEAMIMIRKSTIIFAAGFLSAVGLLGLLITSSQLDTGVQAQNKAMAAEQGSGKWSPTKPYPKHNVYYPGTEELKPDEMRVIACGSGIPMPRLK